MSTITTLIYGGGPIYAGGNAVIKDLKDSGFTTVVAWCVHLHEKGDLFFNDVRIVSDGKYIGDSEWPSRLLNLKQGGSVTRLLFSMDFFHVHSLMESQGTGPDSILYQNFAALKSAIPSIDGIDFDDEKFYDHSTTVKFSEMLKTIGYEITFCPYTAMSFWVDCLHSLNGNNGNTVTGFNLQCYSGGAGNDPGTWINAIQEKMGSDFDAKGFVFPGLWCRHGDGCVGGNCPVDITSQFKAWKPEGIQGGFIWLYDDIEKCKDSGICSGSMDTAAYATAIDAGFSDV